MARYATSEERGVGWTHAKDKKRLEALHRDGDPCWRCGKPMYKSQGLERDHLIDRALGGKHGPAVLAHAHCNRSAGAKLRNQLYPGTAIKPGAPPATCKTCGKTYHAAARMCEICGGHYHPSYGGRGEQRTCGRACGVVLRRRNMMAAGWLPKAERPKPPRVQRVPREPTTWPSSRIQVYTCRYCGKTCVAKLTGQRREVCPDERCQQDRLTANKRGYTPLPVQNWPAEWRATNMPTRPVRRPARRCARCLEPTDHFRWCDACRCTSANAHGYRCRNVATSPDGRCEHHAEPLPHTTTSRDW